MSPLLHQTIEVSFHWSQVIVYLVNLGSSTYVCGMKLIGKDGEDAVESMVGYQSGRFEKLGYHHWNWVDGFVAAVGPQGIRALQLVGEAGELSKWAGNPQNCPITRRLVFDMRTISCIVAGFDVSTFPPLVLRHAASLRSPNSQYLGRQTRQSWFGYRSCTPNSRNKLDDKGRHSEKLGPMVSRRPPKQSYLQYR
jgi:hypothetical protein